MVESTIIHVLPLPFPSANSSLGFLVSFKYMTQTAWEVQEEVGEARLHNPAHRQHDVSLDLPAESNQR